MERVKFVLPVMVILLAIVAAFGTDVRRAHIGTTTYFNPSCLECTTDEPNPEENCLPNIVGEMCECDSGGQLNIKIEGQCEPLWRVEGK